MEVMAALRDALAPRPPLRVQPGFVSGDAARRRSVSFMSAVGAQRLGTHDVVRWSVRGAPGSVMARTWAGPLWLPVWRRGLPLPLCLPWPGRQKRAMSPGSG